MRMGPDGAAEIAHLQLAAERGSKFAADQLLVPPFPDGAEYLWLWAMELFGRSGFTPAGVAPLSYQTVSHWATLTGRHPSPREVTAIMRIDAGLRSTGEETPNTQTDAPQTPPELIPWPEKKKHG